MDALVLSLAVNIFWRWPVTEVFTDGYRLAYFALTFLAGFAVVYVIDLAIRSIIRSRRIPPQLTDNVRAS